LSERSVVEAFARQAAARPDADAVASERERLSYAELDARSAALASSLVRAGVAPGDRVAVCLERSVDLPVTLLGVLKAGAAYLPVDAGEPVARATALLADAEVRLVVADPGHPSAVARPDLPTYRPDQLTGPVGSLPDPRPGDLAYLMCTSGSTGRPKLVMVEHRNITNLVTEPNYVRLGPDECVLQLAPVAFDAATFEIWGALLNGALLALAPPGRILPEQLGGVLRRAGITVLWLTATLFHRQIDVDVDAFRGLRTVLAGGDVLSVPHVRRLLAAVPQCQVVNGYGPTETTTFACCHRLDSGEELAASVPIGRPIQHATAHVMDETGRPVPDGMPGELWIGGAGVSRGYWRAPRLTATRFVAAPDATGGRCYRSGDLVRRRSGGTLEFLCRIDGQVKLRGHRVEPAEIQSVLTEHPAVRQAVVGVRDSHLAGRRLVAWVVPAGAPPERRALRAYLRERLPQYMVPAAFLFVGEIPVTPNGKVDRESLPTPDWRRKDVYV
jgi:amino acid adenylation domain-containing protein